VVSHWKPHRCTSCDQRCRGKRCRACIRKCKDTQLCPCGAHRTRGCKVCVRCRIQHQQRAGRLLRA
jgi:hypothetical protein